MRLVFQHGEVELPNFPSGGGIELVTKADDTGKRREKPNFTLSSSILFPRLGFLCISVDEIHRANPFMSSLFTFLLGFHCYTAPQWSHKCEYNKNIASLEYSLSCPRLTHVYKVYLGKRCNMDGSMNFGKCDQEMQRFIQEELRQKFIVQSDRSVVRSIWQFIAYVASPLHQNSPQP